MRAFDLEVEVQPEKGEARQPQGRIWAKQPTSGSQSSPNREGFSSHHKGDDCYENEPSEHWDTLTKTIRESLSPFPHGFRIVWWNV